MRPTRPTAPTAKRKFDLTNRRYLFFDFWLRLGSATASEPFGWIYRSDARSRSETSAAWRFLGRDNKVTREGDGANNGERRFALQGEVYSDAERLREASALAIGGTLVAAARRLNGRAIETVADLIGEMYRAEAMPPGIEFNAARKCLTSEVANYYVRYRQSPLGVEVVSVCKGQLCGPALLVRLPDDEFSEGALTYYTAPQRGSVPVPAAFSSAGDVIKAGWRPEKFRAQAPQFSN
jgi:hypothetical protein